MINYEFWSKDNDNGGYDDGNNNNNFTDNDRQIHLKPHNAININLSIYLNVYMYLRPSPHIQSKNSVTFDFRLAFKMNQGLYCVIFVQ